MRPSDITTRTTKTPQHKRPMQNEVRPTDRKIGQHRDLQRMEVIPSDIENRTTWKPIQNGNETK